MNETGQSDADQADWLDELYAEGQAELPPPALDARIQAAAREPIRHPWYSRTGRLTTLATAASLVIAAMVIYYIPEEAPAPATESLMMPSTVEEADQTGNQSRLMRISDAPDAAEAFAEEKEADPDRAEPGVLPQAPEPVAAPARESKKAERYRIASDELAGLRANQRVASKSALDSASESDSEITSASPAVAGVSLDRDVQAALAELCGPLPGTKETRALNVDALDWYLTVTVGQSAGQSVAEGLSEAGGRSDERYWRCQDGAWIELDGPVFELPSDEQ